MKKILFIFVYLAINSFSNKVQAQTIDSTSIGETEDEDERSVETPCGGVERWSVKVLTDAASSTVNFTPVNSNLAALVGLTTPAPNAYMLRTGPIEKTVYKITCNITIKKFESDNDYHLVLSDGTHTLIGEIPDPSCTTAATSSHVSEYAAAKAFVDAHIASGNVSNVNIPAVTVTGVGFIDPPHGQTGAPPNNLELHPILDIHFASTNAAPVALFSTSPSNGCLGQSIALLDNSSNSPSTWAWTMPGGNPSSSTSPNPSVAYSATGTYTVSLVVTNTVGSSSLFSKIITVYSNPPVPIITLIGDTLTSSSVSGNQWYLNGILLNGITNQTYIATQPGTYTVVATNPSGCSETSASLIFNNTGINSISIADDLTVFPNPSDGNVTINFNNKKQMTIEIYNNLGQMIYAEKINECTKDCNKKIDISAFPNGIYLFKINANERIFTKKIELIK